MQTCPSTAPAAPAPGPPRVATQPATSPGGVNQARGSGSQLTGYRSATWTLCSRAAHAGTSSSTRGRMDQGTDHCTCSLYRSRSAPAHDCPDFLEGDVFPDSTCPE